MVTKFVLRHKHVIIYGLSLAILLFLLRWLELRLILYTHAIELYVALIAIVFTGLGIWLAVKLAKPKVKTIIVEKEVMVEPIRPFRIDESELAKRGITSRELEVLELMSKGMSNQEIAGKLFLSLNTIKTHTSNLFMKLDVERRTQAIDKAKKLKIIP